MMRKIVLLVSVVCAVLLTSGASLAAQDKFVVFRGEGYAIKFSDAIDFKKVAVESAVKNAVMSAIKSATGEALYRNSSDKLDGAVVLKAEQFVSGYKLLSEGWMVHYDMPDAAAIIGSKKDSESSVKVEDKGPDELTGLIAPGGVEAYHVVVEANVDMKTLLREVRKYVALADEGSAAMSIVILDLLDYKEFETLKERMEKFDFIRTISYVSFARGKMVLKASVTQSGNAFFESMVKELGADYVVIPGGEDRVIIKAERKDN